MSEGNEFIDWHGGECPVQPDAQVEVKFSGGGQTTTARTARVLDWTRRHISGDIVAYRVVETPKPKVKIPEGFTPWAGGACPVDLDKKVRFVLRNGPGQDSAAARHLRWEHGDRPSDIIGYRVIESAGDIPEGFTHWAGGECPVDPDTGVDVVLGDGTSGGSEARHFDWSHVEGRKGNIVAYRTDKPSTPQAARDIQIGGEHYKKASLQPWDVVDTWPIEQQVGFHRGNALKYVMRMGTKDENLNEIRKAAHYLQKLGEVLEHYLAGTDPSN